MPWNKEGGGGNQGPWGQGPWGPGPRKPQGGGPRGPNLPPDLDELLRRGQDRFRNIWPAGGRATWLLPLVLLLLFVLFNSIYQVQPDERGMVLRLGAYTRTAMPGLHFALWPIEKMELLPVAAEKQTSIGDTGDEGLMLTGDENMVDIKFKVLWKISDPQLYLFNISDQERLVRAVAESAMREIVGRTPADEALTTGRLAIQDQVTEIVQRTLDTYKAGIKITGLALENVDPPSQVLDAFEEVQRAKQNQVNLINEAEQYSNQTLRRVEGQAAKIIEDSKGYKARVIAESQGEAQRFNKVYAEYSKAKEVTRERLFLETMEQVISNSNRVLIDPGKTGQGVIPYLPLPAIENPKPTGDSQ
ncbi:MAG TPA: FtsH protease activity modulator HflK [Aestuariivirga sp.]|nr:FtsH protease activity modulator HflK [Aestuariivirga sp.]